MPDADSVVDAQRFQSDIMPAEQGFFLKGSSGYDWGMRNRLARVFRPGTRRTVMLAIDHGYFQGPTTGLERLDLTVAPLANHADAIMLTRGALRTSLTAETSAAIVLRASGGPSILSELSNERLVLDLEDAVRLNAAAVAVQVFVGGEHETQSIENMTRLVDAGTRHGIPVLGVTAVGREITRDARYLRLACRICAELGAQVVKTYYCDEFETITASCPVPIVMAGGKKIPEAEALQMASLAIEAGASGVDMGRNIFQSAAPTAMLKAINAIVHEQASARDALTLFEELARTEDDPSREHLQE